MKEKQFLFENIAAKILISKAAKNRTLVLEARIESEFYLSLRRGIRSFWKRMVRKGEREREREPVLPYSRGFHLEVNVMVRWSLRATRTIPQPEPRGMSVSGPRSAPGRQRNQFAVTCRTTTVFWNNINSPLHDIGPPLGNENPCWTALLLMGTPRFESLATGYVRLRDESGTRPWLSRTEVESGLIRWHEIIVLLLFSFFFLIASSSSSILRYRVDYWIDPWIILYIYCFVMLNVLFPIMLDEFPEIIRWTFESWRGKRGRKDEVATSMEFSWLLNDRGNALR